MHDDLNYPFLVFAVSFFAMWLAARIGFSVLRKKWTLDDAGRQDFDVVQTATLTLLGLIIGFSFSMAVSRYDLRKNYEEAEANAIGTEMARASLLPPADAAKVRALLRSYLDERVAFYVARDRQQIQEVNARTAQLQAELWAAIEAPALAQPNPVLALVASGMNDVLNAQGYTQAAWWNRIPYAAWGLMGLIAICGNTLVGYGARNMRGGRMLLMVLPVIVSVAFLLIADIDSPRGGLIHVAPQNLLSLSASMPAK
jgi:hypothetical protein